MVVAVVNLRLCLQAIPAVGREGDVSPHLILCLTQGERQAGAWLLRYRCWHAEYPHLRHEMKREKRKIKEIEVRMLMRRRRKRMM